MMHAVLIGIGEYGHLSPLQYCQDDLTKFESAISALSGVSVAATFSPKEGPTYRFEIFEALDNVLDRAEETDGLLIYFCGHGMTVGGQFVLCPSDFSTAVPFETGVPLNSLIGRASKLKGAVIIILDCCRTALETARLPIEPGTLQAGYTAVRENVFLMFGCKAGQSSYESPDEDIRGSLFTQSVCEGIALAKRGKRFLSLQQLAEFVEARVYELIFESYRRWSESEPDLDIQTPTFLGGDFSKFCFDRRVVSSRRSRAQVN